MALAVALLFGSIASLRAQAVSNIDYDVVIAGYSGDVATGVVITDAGEVFVTGTSDYEALPPTDGAFVDAGGSVLVAKFNADGTLGFASWLRGRRGEALAVDADGGVFVAGIDDSSGASRGFVAKLSADGSRLEYRTELGPLMPPHWHQQSGAGPYARLALAVGASGRAHVAGTAIAGSPAATAGAFDGTLDGYSDGFVTSLDAAGTVIRKTFLGGSGMDSLSGVVVDAQGNVTVAGTTESADFPVTPGTYAQPSVDGGAFVTSFDADGSVRYSTYFGASSRAHRIARGRSNGPSPAFGGVWITGTSSYTGYLIDQPSFPVTADAYGDFSTLFDMSVQQTFVTHLSDTGEVLYSTSLIPPGTSSRTDEGEELGSDRAISIAVDDALGRANRVYVAGETNRHVNFHLSEDDGFVFRFDFAAGTAGHQGDGTVGGAADEATTDLSVNGRGDAVYAGFTTSYWTAYEYAFDRTPATRVYGRDLAAPYDPEIGDRIPPVVIISKRLAPDVDRDGAPDHLDNCRTVSNPDQADGDGDGRGDACEVPDTDGDGWIDTLDNCPALRNADQADQDSDGAGDLCDPDLDGDGAANAADTCALVPNAGQEDADGDGIGDVCDAFSVPPPHSDQLSLVGTAAAPVQGSPSVLAVNPTAEVVYALTAGRYLRAVDGAAAATTASIQLPFFAESIAADPVTERLFVTDAQSSMLRVLDGATLAEVSQVTMPRPGPAYAGPFAVAINGATRRLYAGAAGVLAVFDADTLAPIRLIPTAAYTRRLWVDEEHDRVYFGNDFGQVWVLEESTGQVAAVEGTAELFVLDVAGHVDRMYWRTEDATSPVVKNLAAASVSVTPLEFRYLGGLRVNAAASRAYAWGDPTLLFDGIRFTAGPLDLYMLDLDGAVLGRFNVPGEGVSTVAVNPASGFIYAADHRGNVHVIRDAGARPPQNTPVGADVAVTVPEGVFATVTFSSVTAPGTTTVTPVADPAALNLTLPGGFAISNTAQAYEIHTTATIAGPIEVCLVASGLDEAAFASAVILHGVGGAWQPEATRRDPATRRLCADVASLSPFAVGTLVDTAPPQITCETPATAWQSSNVGVRCTAADAGAGLASAADASFTLMTSVVTGQEDANAATSSRQVCDRLGNCATAGPVSGIRVDMRPPSIQLTAPAAGRYLLNQPLKASYACADGGSGVAACAGPVATGTTIATATVGSHSFQVTARDAAGNTATANAGYTVGYGLRTLFAQSTAYKVGQTIPLQVQLVDAAGVNRSSSAIALRAVQVTRVSGGAAYPLNLPVPFDAKAKAYGGKVPTKGLPAGTYEIELVAGADPFVHKVRVTLK